MTDTPQDTLNRSLREWTIHRKPKKVRFLLDQGADPSSCFLEACRDPGLMKMFLDKGADVNREEFGKTALTVAMEHHQEPGESLRTLLAHGFRVNPDPDSDALFPNFPLRDVLTERLTYSNENTAWMRKRVQDDLLDTLHQAGADVNAHTRLGMTMLIEECCQPTPRIGLMAQLIEMGADVHAKDHAGNTALHFIVERKEDFDDYLAHQNAAVNLLISKGADPFAKNDDGAYPSHPAAHHARLALEEKALREVASSHRAQAFPSMDQAESYAAPKRAREPASAEPASDIAPRPARRLV